MRKHDTELFKLKIETLRHYDSVYYDFLREAVVSDENTDDKYVKKAIRIYSKRYGIGADGFVSDCRNGDDIRLDTVYRCARLLQCVYKKAPVKTSRFVSYSPSCAISSYGLKHVLEYWLVLLSDNAVSKPFSSAATSYVSNGEAIMACLVFRDQFEDWPASGVWFKEDQLSSVHTDANLYGIHFNSCFKSFLGRKIDRFTAKLFEFYRDDAGHLVARPKFNEKRFMEDIKQPDYFWGAKELEGRLH